MSRIGKMPITIPSGVEVNVAGQSVSVKGPKGTLTHVLAEPIAAKQDGSTLTISRPNETREARSLHGMSRTMISNMIEGVTRDIPRRLISLVLVTKLQQKVKILSLHLVTAIQLILLPMKESLSKLIPQLKLR